MNPSGLDARDWVQEFEDDPPVLQELVTDQYENSNQNQQISPQKLVRLTQLSSKKTIPLDFPAGDCPEVKVRHELVRFTASINPEDWVTRSKMVSNYSCSASSPPAAYLCGFLVTIKNVSSSSLSI